MTKRWQTQEERSFAKHYQESPVVICNSIEVINIPNYGKILKGVKCYVRQPRVGKKIEDPVTGEQVVGFKSITIQESPKHARLE